MSLLDRFKQIRCLAFDVDGVLTDGNLLIMASGEWARSMNIKDGYALQLAVKMGYRVLVISGGNALPVKERLEKLGVKDVFMQVENKEFVLNEYLRLHGIPLEGLLYMGDDIPDLGVMKMAGLPCCPADAAPEIKACSTYISPFPGGGGCVREVIEKVLKLNGHWDLKEVTSSR
jgi:3-deoxy-D-manno-octulosonate 8-phosphate phosphatase (KDO 8-P phosphatase)